MERRGRLLIALLSFLTLETAAASDLATLMQRCAPNVHPTTLAQIVRQESGGQLYALSDDGPGHLPWSERKKLLRSFYPASKQEADAIVKGLSKRGHLVGIGLTQISSRHLRRLGLSVSEALEPCMNLKAGAQILTEFYAAALKKFGGDTQKALIGAISAYNTGSFHAGVTNGYVARVLARAGGRVPALRAGRSDRKVAAAVDEGRRAPARTPRSMLLEAKFATIEVETF